MSEPRLQIFEHTEPVIKRMQERRRKLLFELDAECRTLELYIFRRDHAEMEKIAILMQKNPEYECEDARKLTSEFSRIMVHCER